MILGSIAPKSAVDYEGSFARFERWAIELNLLCILLSPVVGVQYTVHLYIKKYSASTYLQWSASFNLQRLSFGLPRLSNTKYASIFNQLGKCFKKRDRVSTIPLPDFSILPTLLESCSFVDFTCIFIFVLAISLCLRAGEVWLFDCSFLNASLSLLTWPAKLMQNGVKHGRVRRVYKFASPFIDIINKLGANPAKRVPRAFLQRFLQKYFKCSLNSARHVGAHYVLKDSNDVVCLKECFGGHATFLTSSFYIDFLLTKDVILSHFRPCL